jgi:hypothetical protein
MPAPQLALALVYLVHDSLRIVLTLILVLIAPTWAQARAKARHLFVAHQLALYHAREAPRKPTTPAFRLTTVFSRLFDWRDALVIVRPETLVRWHREGFTRLWRKKSRPRGRPAIPPETVARLREEIA